MPDEQLTLRAITPSDLPAINQVIEAAVQTWNLPDRVKRLSLPSYQYDAFDLSQLAITGAWLNDTAVAVAAWEPAELADNPPEQRLLLLHGLYVAPDHWRQGLGTRMIAAAQAASAEKGLTGVLVKAQADAVPYFVSRGFRPVPVTDTRRDYQHRLWMPA